MAEVIRINKDTVRIEDGGVRFFLLEGSEKALLIDTGMNTPDAKKIAESLTDLPLILINTHADRDHISGNPSFDTFYMSPAEVENYAFDMQQLLMAASIISRHSTRRLRIIPASLLLIIRNASPRMHLRRQQRGFLQVR